VKAEELGGGREGDFMTLQRTLIYSQIAIGSRVSSEMPIEGKHSLSCLFFCQVLSPCSLMLIAKRSQS